MCRIRSCVHSVCGPGFRLDTTKKVLRVWRLRLRGLSPLLPAAARLRLVNSASSLSAAASPSCCRYLASSL